MEACFAAVGAAGGALHYLTYELKRNASHIRGLRLKNPADFLVIDEPSRINLDIVERAGRARRTPGRGGNDAPTTLLDVLNDTKTAMGGRMLREWVIRPLANINAIRARHDAVETLAANQTMLKKLGDALTGTRDMERLIARLNAGGNARDLKALEQSLKTLPKVLDILKEQSSGLIAELKNGIFILPDLAELIEAAIVDEPPVPIKEGGMIRRGYNAELDDLKTPRQAAGTGSRNTRPGNRNAQAYAP